MKKLTLALLTAGVFAMPSLASAAEPYVSLSAGLGMMQNQDIVIGGETHKDAVEYKSGLAIEGAVGTKMDKYRGELAIGYQSNDMDKIVGVSISDIELSVLSYMANAYADFSSDKEISPYIMAGVGFATITGKSGGESTDDTVFAYQVGAGIGMKASEQATIDLGYRYLATDDAENLIDGWAVNFGTSRVMLGLRYNF